VIPGFAGAEVLYDDDTVIGVRTSDMGIAKDGSMKDSFEPGVDIIAK
jgi:electron-transferring-flavoprotein dehydrogenase